MRNRKLKKSLSRLVIAACAISLLTSCSVWKRLIGKKGDLQTKSLYMQFDHPQITLPDDGKGGNSVVSEQVTYNHADNELSEKYQPIKGTGRITDVQHLGEVVVTSKSRFTPERDGKINVDFIIRVPKALLSPKWRMTLSPKLLHNDSIVNLQEIILSGADFVQAQKNTYSDYDKYLKSIVPKSKYDSAFLNQKKIAKDINRYEGNIYDRYYGNWNKQKNYLEYYNQWKKRQEYFTYKERVFKAYPTYAEKAYRERFKRLLDGKDSTGVYEQYKEKYKADTKEHIDHWEKRKQKALEERPTKGIENLALQNVKSITFTKRDSVTVAKNSYFWKDVVRNDIKGERRDSTFNEIVKYPYQHGLLLDTVLTADKDFVFFYKQSYRVVPGLKKVRIYMDSKVNAIDQSTYYSPSIDTLSYFIASLSQLVDTTLSYKVQNLTRMGINQISAKIKYSPNGAFNIDYKDNKAEVAQVLDFIDALNQNKVYAVDSVNIEVSHSLAGDYTKNQTLSEKEANSFRVFLAQKFNFGNVKIISEGIGENWNGLVREIRQTNSIQNKDEILNVIATTTYPDKTENEIKAKFKSDFDIISSEIYPRLERTTVLFNVHRTDMTTDTEIRKEFKGTEYQEGLRYLQEREYWKAMQILANYGDYNTALCLLCLGYNAKAYELLKSLSQTGDNEYLLALVSYRLQKGDEAAQHLRESIKLDPAKKYRISLDAEVSELAKIYNIK